MIIIPTNRQLATGDELTSREWSCAASRDGSPPDDKAVAGGLTPPEDQRLAAFAAFLDGVDRSDVPATLAATRHLRKLGYSVVVLGTPGGGGGRS